MAKGKKGKHHGVPRTNLAKRIGGNNGVGVTPTGVIEVTDETWSRLVLQSEQPVLVDFWAPWCGPCKLVGPIVESLAAERKGKLRVVKYNTEASRRIAAELEIRSIPTMALYRRGALVGTRAGAMSKAMIGRWIDAALGEQLGLPSPQLA
jgi:thioredoxin